VAPQRRVLRVEVVLHQRQRLPVQPPRVVQDDQLAELVVLLQRPLRLLLWPI
jgi:hypothetical protein